LSRRGLLDSSEDYSIRRGKAGNLRSLSEHALGYIKRTEKAPKGGDRVRRVDESLEKK